MKFEKGIPIPNKQPVSPLRKTISAMSIGDSFVVGDGSEQRSILSVAKKMGIKITTRKLDGTGYRVWRLS